MKEKRRSSEENTCFGLTKGVYNLVMTNSYQQNSSSILMQTVQSNWLSYCTPSAFRVQWPEVVYKIALFPRLSEASEEYLETSGQSNRGNRFLMGISIRVLLQQLNEVIVDLAFGLRWVCYLMAPIPGKMLYIVSVKSGKKVRVHA